MNTRWGRPCLYLAWRHLASCWDMSYSSVRWHHQGSRVKDTEVFFTATRESKIPPKLNFREGTATTQLAVSTGMPTATIPPPSWWAWLGLLWSHKQWPESLGLEGSASSSRFPSVASGTSDSPAGLEPEDRISNGSMVEDAADTGTPV